MVIAFTIPTLAKKLGYPPTRFRRSLNELVEKGYVKIQHSGFKSDSHHHHKIVVLLKSMDEIRNFLSPPKSPFVRGETILGYKVRKARKPHKCSCCDCKIEVGALYGQKVTFPPKQVYKLSLRAYLSRLKRGLPIPKPKFQTDDLCVGCLKEKTLFEELT